VKNLQIESNTSASGNGFSSTGYGNLTYDGTEILGSGGVGNWTKDGTNIYYNGGNVGIQNTNPTRALVVGEPGNTGTDVEINSSVVINGTISGQLDASDLTTGTLPIARIANGEITTGKLGDGAVTTAKLATDSVTNTKLSTDIDAGKLTTGTLPIARIANGAITTAKLENESVTNAKVALSGINAGKLTAGNLPNGRLGDDYTGVGSITLASSKNLTISSTGRLYIGSSYNTSASANIVARIRSTGELRDFGLLPSFIAYSISSILTSTSGSIVINNCFPLLFNNAHVKSYTICFIARRTSLVNSAHFGFRVIDNNGNEYTSDYRNGSTSEDLVKIASQLSTTSSVFNIKIVRSESHYDFSGLNSARTFVGGNDNEGFIISCSLPENAQMSSIKLLLSVTTDNFTVADFKTIAHSTV
jgi:hypothetical protein